MSHPALDTTTTCDTTAPVTLRADISIAGARARGRLRAMGHSETAAHATALLVQRTDPATHGRCVWPRYVCI